MSPLILLVDCKSNNLGQARIVSHQMNGAILNIMKGCELQSLTIRPACTNKRMNNPTIDDFIEEIAYTTNMEELGSVCPSIRDHYGFDFFSLLVRFNRLDNQPICYFVRDFDNDWSHYYQKNKCILYDPGIRISVSTTIPFLWSSHALDDLGNFLNVHEIEHCARAFDFGMRDVFNAPFIGKYGEYGLIRFVRYKIGQASDEDVIINRHKIPELCYLASHVCESLSRLLGCSKPQSVLTEREKDVLLWTAHGKNPANIACNLRISENTVCKHLSNVRKKLNVRSITHAVAKAISSGYINI